MSLLTQPLDDKRGRGRSGGAYAYQEFSGSSTKHSNVPPPGILRFTLKFTVFSKRVPPEFYWL